MRVGEGAADLSAPCSLILKEVAIRPGDNLTLGAYLTKMKASGKGLICESKVWKNKGIKENGKFWI